AHILFILYIQYYGHNRNQHSFPTRRSSDLSSKLICIASRTSNIRIKNGVAKIEKPKPVLVCKTEETNIRKINKITESINDTFHARKRYAALASEALLVCKHSNPPNPLT